LESYDQVDRNYDAFLKLLPELLKRRPGYFALMHDEEIVEFFDSAAKAVANGLNQFGVGKYSVQEVKSQAEDLGFYSYAGSSMQA
jgi:hypothetical protein